MIKQLAIALTLLLTTTTVSARNFHEIDRNRYFRSSQLAGWELEDAIKQYGIKTVINLRGANPNDRWYRNEKAVVNKYNVKHIDISMSADTIPTRENLLTLLDAFANAPRPILVHCKAGADRTGEASAIYVQEFMGKSREESLDMLRIKYGHLRQFKPAKSYFIKHVYQGMEWAKQSYQPCAGKYAYVDRSSCQ